MTQNESSDRTPDDSPDGTAEEPPEALESAHESSADRLTGGADWSVPAGETTFTCEHCGRPFARENQRALHRGLAHGDSLTEADRDAYEEALAEERADLRRFRIVALGALVLLYFGFLLTYAVFA